MLGDLRNQIVEFARFSEENLAFAVDGVFLQIEGDCLRGAEVFHCLGHVEAGFFCDAEEMVDCRFCGENDSGVLRERYFLLSEFF